MVISPGMTISFSNAEAFVTQLKIVAELIDQNQLQEAASHLNLLGKTATHDPRLFLLGSRLAQASNNTEGVLKAARKAHQLAPQWLPAIIHLAEVLASLGEAEQAMTLAVQAVQQMTTLNGQVPIDLELLAKAAALAQSLNRPVEALQWLRQAEQASPGDLTIQHQIARTLSMEGDQERAIALLNKLLTLLPDNPTLLLDRLRIFLSTGQTIQAVGDGRALLALAPDNEEYRFYLSIALGETPKTQPASVVTGIFNRQAGNFDRHVVVGLQYKLPRDVARMIHLWHPNRKGDVLDLGCGTGLLGACLGPIEGVIVGVDLSAQMVEQAIKHRVYDRFHQVNLLDALQATPANLYDVIAALDVLIYIGNLDSVIPSAHRILVPGGRFVFSCESGSDDKADYVLQRTYRYTHQQSYVVRLLRASGFEPIEIEDRVLRYEGGQPVKGFLITAQKPLHVPQNTTQLSVKNFKQMDHQR